MSPFEYFQSVHWVKNYEITDAEQPIAPILGILSVLRSNQWLVLFRGSGSDHPDYFPFRKRELVDRLSNEPPFAIAAVALALPDDGVQVLTKRVQRIASSEGQEVETSRFALVDDHGGLIGIGVPSEKRQDISSLTAFSESGTQKVRRVSDALMPGNLEIASEEPLNDEGEPKSPPQETAAAQPPRLIVPVYYATDRKRDPKSTAASVKYNDERAQNETVSIGFCNVSIPKKHQLGKLERPPIWKIWARPKPDEHIMLLSTVELAAQEFWQKLSSDIGTSSDRDAFVFVHGYNVSFETAALRTAQLATDLSFRGGPIMFSWPSKGRLANYLEDEGSIQWSRPHLRKFIEDICLESKAASIHLIAHSMGSRALLEVIQTLSASSLPRGTLKQLIFAAPDIDSGVFQQAASAISNYCARVTLYASERDKALKASKKIHGFPRAGEAGKTLLVLSGVDTIDASMVDTDFLGHSGFAEDRPIMQDVHSLVQHNDPPNKRFGLEQRASNLGTYWFFKP
jgi:esterase/lipase superfamily enzyme